MGLFKIKKKKEPTPPPTNEADELKAMQHDFHAKKNFSAPTQNEPKQTAPSNQQVLSNIEAVVNAAKDQMRQGYSLSNLNNRFDLFTKACEMLIGGRADCEALCRSGAASRENLDKISCLICECCLNMVWSAENLGLNGVCNKGLNLIQTTFSTIQTPNAMAHFALAHSRVVTMADPWEFPAPEWKTILYHYTSAIQLIDTLENDHIGVYAYACYNIGLCHKYGWGIERDINTARMFLTEALNAGFDCQDSIDDLD